MHLSSESAFLLWVYFASSLLVVVSLLKNQLTIKMLTCISAKRQIEEKESVKLDQYPVVCSTN